MAITNQSIYTSVWTTVKDIIVAAAPFVTNSTTSATTAASIRASFNDVGAVRPQIIIEPVEKDEVQDKFGTAEGKKLINVTISCYYSNTLGVDQLSEQVEYALKTNEPNGIDLVGITSDNAFQTGNDQKYHLKTIVFSYDRE